MVVSILRFFAGLFAWSLAEYLTHRFPMHGRRGSSPLADEHLDHHGSPQNAVRLAVDRHNLMLKGAAGAASSWLVAPAFGLGFVTGYTGYTHLHHQIHHRQPRSPLARRMWLHHYQHHFGSPARNFGVTSPVWDHLFGTMSEGRR